MKVVCAFLSVVYSVFLLVEEAYTGLHPVGSC